MLRSAMVSHHHSDDTSEFSARVLMHNFASQGSAPIHPSGRPASGDEMTSTNVTSLRLQNSLHMSSELDNVQFRRLLRSI